MIQNDLSKKYSRGAIIIHWLTAVLILILFPMGKYMHDFPAIEKMGLIRVHASLGMVVFIITLIRCYLFFKSPRPENIMTGSKFNDKLAVWIHNAFYFLLLGMAVSGIGTMILGGYLEALQTGNAESIKAHGEVPPLAAHNTLAIIMIILLILHIAGVVKHYISTKENTLKRMM